MGPCGHRPAPQLFNSYQRVQLRWAAIFHLATFSNSPCISQSAWYRLLQVPASRSFICSCCSVSWNFWDQKDLFHNDSAKVNYVLSYLKGPALDCFEPRLLKPHEPLWLSNYDLFVSELEINFGSYDPVWGSKGWTWRFAYAGKSSGHEIFRHVHTASLMCSMGWGSTPPPSISWSHQMHQGQHGPPWETTYPLGTPQIGPVHRLPLLRTTRKRSPHHFRPLRHFPKWRKVFRNEELHSQPFLSSLDLEVTVSWHPKKDSAVLTTTFAYSVLLLDTLPWLSKTCCL